MPYGPFEQALVDLTCDDIQCMIADAPPESLFLDFKRDLSEKGGGESAWRRGEDNVSQSSRNALARMIVAFANAEGGTLIVGIEETGTKPDRPAAIDPLPQPATLADRLRRALRDRIEPELDRLEVEGVVTEAEKDAGVVVLRVPPSTNAPHRVKLKDGFGVFVRREDQTLEATMREVHEITLRREASFSRFERLFSDAAETFESAMRSARSPRALHGGTQSPMPSSIAIPDAVGWNVFTAPMRAVSVDLAALSPFPYAKIKDGTTVWAENTQGRPFRNATPILGGRTRTSRAQSEAGSQRTKERTWYRDGRSTIRDMFVQTQLTGSLPEIDSEWLADALLDSLVWILAVRVHVRDPMLPFGIQVSIDNRDGITMIPERSGDEPSRVISALATSPIYEITAGNIPDAIVQALVVDMANAFGNDLVGRQFTIAVDNRHCT